MPEAVTGAPPHQFDLETILELPAPVASFDDAAAQ
jgi:hypothetical protein